MTETVSLLLYLFLLYLVGAAMIGAHLASVDGHIHSPQHVELAEPLVHVSEYDDVFRCVLFLVLHMVLHATGS